jgi:hypothetical protein
MNIGCFVVWDPMKKSLRLLLLGSPLLGHSALAVELSGAIRSSTGPLPAAITVVANSAGDKPAVVGSVENGRYHIDLPSPGRYRLRLEAREWDAEPKTIFDPARTGAPDFLISSTPILTSSAASAGSGTLVG